MSQVDKLRWLQETFKSSIITESNGSGSFISNFIEPIFIGEMVGRSIASSPANASGADPETALENLFNRMSRHGANEHIYFLNGNRRMIVEPSTRALKLWAPSA